MKCFYRLSAVVACAALLAACSSGKDVKGNGQITTQDRDIPSFNKVDIKGNFNVMFVRRWPQKIAVTVDSNLQPYVLTTVKDNTLDIMPRQDFNVKSTKPILVKVSTRKLEEIKTEGSSTIDATGLNVDTFEFKVRGATKANLAGRVDKADIDIDGAAKIDAQNLMAKNVELDVKGAAETKVHATQKLDVKIHGTAEVTYFGKPPVVNQAIFGGGKLIAAKKTS